MAAKIIPNTGNTPATPSTNSKPIPDAVRNFDSLPNTANTRPRVAQILLDVSAATFWRMVKSGKLKTRKTSQGVTAVNVGDLRAVLRGE